jgi:hypothetical protein
MQSASSSALLVMFSNVIRGEHAICPDEFPLKLPNVKLAIFFQLLTSSSMSASRLVIVIF